MALAGGSPEADDGDMSKQITVGYDGSAPSAEAVAWAAFEAAARGSRLRIVTCYEIPVMGDAAYWPTGDVYALLLDGAQKSVSAMRAVVAEQHPGLEIVTDASAGPASSALLDDVEPEDLVVVGASSHEGASAFWLGSTPRQVVRQSPCPVVVVRGAASRGRPDRIVVAVDGSPASNVALRWAADEADLHGVTLVVLHAWEYPYLPVDTTSTQGRDITRVDAACLLDQSAALARERCAADVVDALVEDSPVSALLATVRDGDLVVLGSRGRGAVRAGLFGSTVNSVLERSAVPVVVVRC